MDPNRMTEKAQDAVRQAQTLAQRHGQSQIEPEHLAVALLTQDGGLAARVIEKAGVAVATLQQRLQHAISRLPRVSGPGAPAGQVYVSPRVNEVLNTAETEAQRPAQDETECAACQHARSLHGLVGPAWRMHPGMYRAFRTSCPKFV